MADSLFTQKYICICFTVAGSTNKLGRSSGRWSDFEKTSLERRGWIWERGEGIILGLLGKGWGKKDKGRT
jgi:hypothetical protein